MALILVKPPLMHFSKALTRLRHVQVTQKDLDKFDIAKKSTKVRYLNQSYLFHLVALWETFIENLARYEFEKMIKNANLGAAEALVKSHVNYFAEGMNSPKQGKIDDFFENTLGIEKVTNAWEWEGMLKGQACKILIEIMEARNQIGHMSYTSHELSFEKNFEYMKHLYNLAFLTENAAERYVAENLGEEVPPINKNVPYPENLVSMKNVSKKKGK